MANKITEVSHTKSGGFDPVLALVTGGVGALTALDPVEHKVTVRDEDGNRATGYGSTRSEARSDASGKLKR